MSFITRRIASLSRTPAVASRSSSSSCSVRQFNSTLRTQRWGNPRRPHGRPHPCQISHVSGSLTVSSIRTFFRSQHPRKAKSSSSKSSSKSKPASSSPLNPFDARDKLVAQLPFPEVINKMASSGIRGVKESVTLQLSEARVAFQNGDLQKSKQLYESVLESEPLRPAVHDEYGKLLAYGFNEPKQGMERIQLASVKACECFDAAKISHENEELSEKYLSFLVEFEPSNIFANFCLALVHLAKAERFLNLRMAESLKSGGEATLESAPFLSDSPFIKYLENARHELKGQMDELEKSQNASSFPQPMDFSLLELGNDRYLRHALNQAKSGSASETHGFEGLTDMEIAAKQAVSFEPWNVDALLAQSILFDIEMMFAREPHLSENPDLLFERWKSVSPRMKRVTELVRSSLFLFQGTPDMPPPEIIEQYSKNINIAMGQSSLQSDEFHATGVDFSKLHQRMSIQPGEPVRFLPPYSPFHVARSFVNMWTARAYDLAFVCNRKTEAIETMEEASDLNGAIIDKNCATLAAAIVVDYVNDSYDEFKKGGSSATPKIQYTPIVGDILSSVFAHRVGRKQFDSLYDLASKCMELFPDEPFAYNDLSTYFDTKQLLLKKQEVLQNCIKVLTQRVKDADKSRDTDEMLVDQDSIILSACYVNLLDTFNDEWIDEVSNSQLAKMCAKELSNIILNRGIDKLQRDDYDQSRFLITEDKFTAVLYWLTALDTLIEYHCVTQNWTEGRRLFQEYLLPLYNQTNEQLTQMLEMVGKTNVEILSLKHSLQASYLISTMSLIIHGNEASHNDMSDFWLDFDRLRNDHIELYNVISQNKSLFDGTGNSSLNSAAESSAAEAVDDDAEVLAVSSSSSAIESTPSEESEELVANEDHHHHPRQFEIITGESAHFFAMFAMVEALMFRLQYNGALFLLNAPLNRKPHVARDLLLTITNDGQFMHGYGQQFAMVYFVLANACLKSGDYRDCLYNLRISYQKCNGEISQINKMYYRFIPVYDCVSFIDYWTEQNIVKARRIRIDHAAQVAAAGDAGWDPNQPAPNLGPAPETYRAFGDNLMDMVIRREWNLRDLNEYAKSGRLFESMIGSGFKVPFLSADLIQEQVNELCQSAIAERQEKLKQLSQMGLSNEGLDLVNQHCLYYLVHSKEDPPEGGLILYPSHVPSFFGLSEADCRLLFPNHNF